MRPSKHFNERVKLRVGLNKSSSSTFLNKAIEFGLTREDFTNRPRFIRYLDSITVSDNEYRFYIYNHYIIVYATTYNVAVTVLNLPREYISTVKSIKKQKEILSHDKGTSKTY